MKHFNQIIFLFLSFIFYGCNPNCICNDRNYKDLVLNELQNEKLLQEIQNFEINNPAHFDSKIFLADYFLKKNNFALAGNYLQRAEELLIGKGLCCSSKNVCRMYELITQIHMAKKEIQSAVEYASKAVKNEYSENGKNRYLLGRTFYIAEEYEKAAENYEIAFLEYPDEMNIIDARNYMFALNVLKKYDQAEDILNRICKSGLWFNGLGKFASSLYKNINKVEKSIIFTYLDYEFSNQTYENSLVQNETLKDFFGYQFLQLKEKINSQNINEQDFIQLLSLEPYFIQFTSFYWLVWESVKLLAFDERINFLSVLKKIIALNPDGMYADFARKEILELMSCEENLSNEMFDRIFF